MYGEADVNPDVTKAIRDAEDLLADALDGPAGEDDSNVGPLRRIITTLKAIEAEEPTCPFDCDVCRED